MTTTKEHDSTRLPSALSDEAWQTLNDSTLDKIGQYRQIARLIFEAHLGGYSEAMKKCLERG